MQSILPINFSGDFSIIPEPAAAVARRNCSFNSRKSSSEDSISSMFFVVWFLLLVVVFGDDDVVVVTVLRDNAGGVLVLLLVVGLGLLGGVFGIVDLTIGGLGGNDGGVVPLCEGLLLLINNAALALTAPTSLTLNGLLLLLPPPQPRLLALRGYPCRCSLLQKLHLPR